ncbi:capsular polysaccharide biosynthesis protein [Shinella sp.]|uniref:capsular polysaccharide export protein, LipB/KpsS family n=1 Tax=Shinella sp. TaxID=1870904 RepID=UPI00289AD575|nr:capsular polysaccharide biosynthesis protein [Shinella sp.]
MSVLSWPHAEGAFARHATLSAGGRVIAFHMKAWKHPFLRQFFPHKQFHFADLHLTERKFRRSVMPLLSDMPRPVVFVWGNNLPAFALGAIRDLGLQVFYIEDGFIRSLEGQAGYSVPFSLSIDCQRPYFDARGPSDLESLLLTHDFDGDHVLMQRAKAGMRAIAERRLTKYNGPADAENTAMWDQAADRKRILVVGQVEDDASIRLGCDRSFTNNDLVRLAAAENPGAMIYYKPHPDVLARTRQQLSDPAEVAGLCTIIEGRMSLPDALDNVDHVYTITSLAGFEALMRGKSVTVAGAPFYAGWGLTDDRQPLPRRGRQLSIKAIFAAAYILYPSYFDIDNGAASSFEDILERVTARKESLRPTGNAPVRWQAFGSYGLLGWRHLLTPVVATIIGAIGNECDAAQYRANPIVFFRELKARKYRIAGRILYPWDV